VNKLLYFVFIGLLISSSCNQQTTDFSDDNFYNNSINIQKPRTAAIYKTRPETNVRFSQLFPGRFRVIDYPKIIPGTEAKFLSPDDIVLGVEIDGASRAYPVKMAWFHHIFNDEIAGVPILVTY